MNAQIFCPISKDKINEHVTRLNAFFTFALLTLFLLTGSIYFLGFLLIDFLLRSTGKSNLSLLSIVSKRTVRYLNTGGTKINAGPKIFAARIGLVMTSLILLSSVFQVQWMSIGLSGVLLLFSFLEAVLGFCVACHIYSFLFRLGMRS